MSMEPSPNTVTLPPGVSIGPGRETSRTTPAGTVEQGLAFTLTLPDNTSTSVFVPYSVINNTSAVEAVIAQRVAAIQAITGA
jgi:hypothetical protein